MQVREAVEEGTEVVKNRQKAIRITDRSELGWAVVNEYGEDELADDSDNEKRIARAVATAERKQPSSKGNQGEGFMYRNGQQRCRLGPSPTGFRISRFQSITASWSVFYMCRDWTPTIQLSKEPAITAVSFEYR